ncbi:MAG: hypothetical protein ACREPL_14890 [Rhodanobacteraceae bacterium]
MGSPDAALPIDAAPGTGDPGALIAALEAALGREYDALLARDPDTLLAACSSKVAAVEAIEAVRRTHPRAMAGWRPQLRAAAVANVRNQTLLSVLRAYVDDRVRILGLAGSVYDRTGQRRVSVAARSLSVG